MDIKEYSCLTLEQRIHFLERGWVRIAQAIPAEHVAKFTKDVWIRLGYDKDDPSTWEEEKLHLPRQREMAWKEFMPKGWGAICELVGGEDRIDDTIFNKVGDSLIVNLGTEEWRDRTIAPKDLGNWHVDGNWFRHGLDSGEQALLCLQLFNDIQPRAGGTYICEDGLKHVIKWLHDRPQGTNPKLQDPDGSSAIDAIQHCKNFVELTGQAGDIIICHPFMICVLISPRQQENAESAQIATFSFQEPSAHTQMIDPTSRFITSPHLALKGPMNFSRENPEDYSLVELKTLRELGVSALPNWKITTPRERFTPPSQSRKNARMAEELQRMKEHAAKTGGVVESIHLNGIAKYLVGTDK